MPQLSARVRLRILLKTERDRLTVIHLREAPRGGIPVGGGEWMDSFFRLEGIRGFISSLVTGKSVVDALREAKEFARVAVRKWNARREWQVHRWEETADCYLESLVRRSR